MRGRGFWLGREAVRHALDQVRHYDPPYGALTRAVLAHLLPGKAPAWAVSAGPPPGADRVPPPHDAGSVGVGSAALGAGSVEVLLRAECVEALFRVVYGAPPLALAGLAPLVSAAGDDPAAGRIVEEAAGHLVACAARIRLEDDTSPLVFAGSVLTREGPIGGAVRERVSRVWRGPVSVAREAADAAAWLAARDLVRDPVAVHRRIMG